MNAETSTTIDRGPLIPYQVTWASGHIETIEAHQVMMPMPRSPFDRTRDIPERVMFHGEIDGRWGLILSAAASEIVTVRRLSRQDVTTTPAAHEGERGEA